MAKEKETKKKVEVGKEIKEEPKLTKEQEERLKKTVGILEETQRVLDPDTEIAVFILDRNGRMSYNLSNGAYRFKARIKDELEILQFEQVYQSLYQKQVGEIQQQMQAMGMESKAKAAIDKKQKS